MPKIDLLSKNDLNALRRALRGGKEIQLEREMTGERYRLQVNTVPADPVWYPAKMLLRLQVWDGGIYYSQYYPSVEEMLRLRW